jgi:uncharacterized SAM-binding protein YcdF (DUF218 family)
MILLLRYAQPLLLIFIAMALAGLLFFRSRKGRRLALAGVLGIFVISWPPLDWLFGLPLEARYDARPFEPPPNLQAVVVLAGSFKAPEYERPYAAPGYDTFTRCQHAVWIAKRWNLPILACQGQHIGKGLMTAMRDLLILQGMPENMVWTEGLSQSTHENAVFSARILREHGVKKIALIVDGQSMPRAAACFRKEGIDVAPAPIELRRLGPVRDELLPSWKAIQRNETTLHESVAYILYKLRGWV